jgi:hypothetical protein
MRKAGNPSRKTVTATNEVAMNTTNAASETVPDATTMTPPLANHIGMRAWTALRPSQARSDCGHHDGRLEAVHESERRHDLISDNPVNRTIDPKRATSNIRGLAEYRHGDVSPIASLRGWDEVRLLSGSNELLTPRSFPSLER